MGLHVAAVDVTEPKLALARESGAEVTVNAKLPDAVEQVVKQTGGGTHGALVTAPSVPAFRQAIHMVRRKGTVALVGLPPGEFPTPIFDVVLGRITIRGSIVGGRQDLDEAIEFAAEGKVHSHYHEIKLEDIKPSKAACQPRRTLSRLHEHPMRKRHIDKEFIAAHVNVVRRAYIDRLSAARAGGGERLRPKISSGRC